MLTNITEKFGITGCLKNELEGLESTLSTIKAELLDAEEEQGESEAIKNWLGKIKDTAYDLDDTLDELAENTIGRLQSDVSTFFSLPKQLCETMAHKLKTVREKLDVMAGERSKFHLREGMEPMLDRQPSVSDATNDVGDHVSIDVATDAPILASTALEQTSSENVGRGHSLRGKINGAQIVVVVNFLIELMSAAFDQLSSVHKPKYALIAMLISFVASFICITELAYKSRKERVVWRWKIKLPWFYYPYPRNKRFGSVSEIIGLICAILQSISSAIVYAFYMRHADYPIKISIWPIVFAFCLLCSKFMQNPSQNDASGEGDRLLPI